MPRRFTIRRSAVIDAPVEAVYGVVADVARYPEFLPGIQTVRFRGPLVEMSVNVGPLVLTWTQRVTFQPPRSIAFEQVDGPFRLFCGSWTFEDVGGRTHVSYVTEFELGLLLPGVDRIVAQALARNADAIIGAFHQRLQRGASDE